MNGFILFSLRTPATNAMTNSDFFFIFSVTNILSTSSLDLMHPPVGCWLSSLQAWVSLHTHRKTLWRNRRTSVCQPGSLGSRGRYKGLTGRTPQVTQSALHLLPRESPDNTCKSQNKEQRENTQVRNELLSKIISLLVFIYLFFLLLK